MYKSKDGKSVATLIKNNEADDDDMINHPFRMVKDI